MNHGEIYVSAIYSSLRELILRKSMFPNLTPTGNQLTWHLTKRSLQHFS